MSKGSLPAILEHLRQWAAPEASSLSDGELLRRFCVHRESAAFAALMQRHAPLVWRVCRNVLRQEQDAEDAFQATFLVLAQSAGSIRKSTAVASWLHGTAYHIARRARRDAATRQTHERKGASMPPTQPVADSALREILAILDEEVQKLPPRQRAVFVLCALEGKSQVEAALQLSWKEGTISGTLSRAREQLRRRLARRGVELSAALAGLALTTEQAPAALAERTLHAALAFAARNLAAGTISAPVASLVRQATQGQAVTKLRLAVFLLGASVIATSVAGFAGWQSADQPATDAVPLARPADVAKPERAPRERTDRFGDPLPPGVVTRVGTVRWWHGRNGDDNYHCPIAYTPDGKYLVLCDNGKAVRILDAATGREIRRIEPALTPKERKRLDDSMPGDVVTCFALSPNGKRLVTGCCWSPPLRVWDVATGKEIQQIAADPSGTSVLAFSPDGKLIAANATILDAATGKEFRRITDKRANNCSHGLVFSADGKTLITVNGHALHFWDVGTGRFLRSLGEASASKGPGFTQPVVSPDGKRLAAWCSQDALYLWDAAGRETICRIKLGPYMPLYCFSPDGRTLACNISSNRQNATLLFAADTGRERRHWIEEDVLTPTHLAFSPDGKILAQVREGVIRLRDTATGKLIPTTPGLPSGVTAVRFLGDGKTLQTSCLAGRTGLWDAFTGQPLAPFQDPPKDIVHSRMDTWQRAALTADGRKTALVDADGVLHVWETATDAACCRIGPRVDTGEKVIFSPDGKVVALGGYTKLRLWDAATGKLLRLFPVEPHVVRVLAFSPDGRSLAVYYGSTMAISEPPLVRLLDATTGEERSRLAWLGDRDKPPAHLLFTADGKRLIASFDPGPNWSEEEAGWRIGWCVWDLTSGRELRHIRGSAGPIALSPDEKTLAAAEGKTILLWELASGKQRGRFTGHRERIESLAFSPDGRLLASGSLDFTACVWDVTGLCPDGQWTPRRVKQEELERLWTALGSNDGVRAYRALWDLATAGPSAVAFLAQRLRPTPRVEDERITHLITDLDNERFETRDRATEELRRLGERAEPGFRKALAAKPSLEVARRLRNLLDAVESRTLTAEQLHAVRAVEVLEHIGTVEAQRVLKTLANGAPEAYLTNEAKASLERLSRPQRTPSP
jgi:RNA polymerase sigma factor (sigma-70 family)